MKLTTKVLAAAIAMATAGSAHAITNGANGNSQLVLTVYRTDSSASYTRGLTVNNDGATPWLLYNFLPNSLGGSMTPNSGISLTFGLDAAGTTLFQSLFNPAVNGTNIRWNVTAVDANSNPGFGELVVAGQSLNNRAVLTTESLTVTPDSISFNDASVGTATPNGNNFYNNVNAQTSCNSGMICSFTTAGNFNGNTTIFRDDFGLAQSALDNTNAPGNPAFSTPLAFYYVDDRAVSGTAFQRPFKAGSGAGTRYARWDLAANGTLTYSMAPVPVPPAVWLLGSALVGLAGISRRREV